MTSIMDQYGLRSLSLEDKVILYDELCLEIQEADPSLLISPELAAELDRRCAEIDEHPEQCIPWEVVHNEARARALAIRK